MDSNAWHHTKPWKVLVQICLTQVALYALSKLTRMCALRNSAGSVGPVEVERLGKEHWAVIETVVSSLPSRDLVQVHLSPIR